MRNSRTRLGWPGIASRTWVATDVVICFSASIFCSAAMAVACRLPVSGRVPLKSGDALVQFGGELGLRPGEVDEGDFEHLGGVPGLNLDGDSHGLRRAIDGGLNAAEGSGVLQVLSHLLEAFLREGHSGPDVGGGAKVGLRVGHDAIDDDALGDKLLRGGRECGEAESGAEEAG